MALELKDATSRCEFLEKDNKTREADLDKALQKGGKHGSSLEWLGRRSDK